MLPLLLLFFVPEERARGVHVPCVERGLKESTHNQELLFIHALCRPIVSLGDFVHRDPRSGYSPWSLDHMTRGYVVTSATYVRQNTVERATGHTYT